MFLAEGAAEATTSTYSGFDLFMIVVTILIAAGVLLQLKQQNKNKFAIGFGVVCLLAFLFMDVIMIAGWAGIEIKLPFKI
ncbi:hypothetical protein [Paenibacillus sp. y28]|uniref:hypothetical protein n=1 Tax=Paenibacillus sp. y28 TaxID=3129110 RepID=UPI003018FE19